MVATLRRMGRPKKDEPSEPLRIPSSFVRRIRRVALHFKKDPGDYIKERFEAALAEDEAQMFRDQDRERELAKKKPRA